MMKDWHEWLWHDIWHHKLETHCTVTDMLPLGVNCCNLCCASQRQREGSLLPRLMTEGSCLKSLFNFAETEKCAGDFLDFCTLKHIDMHINLSETLLIPMWPLRCSTYSSRRWDFILAFSSPQEQLNCHILWYMFNVLYIINWHVHSTLFRRLQCNRVNAELQ